ncbi:unnamed protein product, partial [Tenebrio molitor]
KAKNPRGETVPSSDIRDGQQRHQGTQGTRRIVSSGHQKFVAANYKVDAEKVAPFHQEISERRRGVGISGSDEGKGASGSFKLASSTSVVPKSPPPPTRETRFVRRIKTKKSSAKRTAVATLPDKASSKTAKKQASPKRRRLLPKERAPPLPPPPQRKPRNRPPPRQKRKLEPPRNPDRLPSEEI